MSNLLHKAKCCGKIHNYMKYYQKVYYQKSKENITHNQSYKYLWSSHCRIEMSVLIRLCNITFQTNEIGS